MFSMQTQPGIRLQPPENMEAGIWKGFVLLVLQVIWVSAESTEDSDLENILFGLLASNKFKMYIRPEKILNQTAEEEPLEIFISLYILNIDLDIRKQECTVQMYFRQEWNDTRLSFSDDKGKIDSLSIHGAVGIWTPDLFFVNEKDGHLHTITKPNIFVRIYPQGRVLYSERVTVKFACPVDLRKYPFDTQTCVIPIESYGYTAKDISLRWKIDDTYGITEQPGFKVSYTTSEYTIEMATSNYSRAELAIHLSRLTYPQLIRVYVPLGLLVAASWLSFCLRSSDRVPRLTTAVTITFATLMFLQSVKEFLYSDCYLTGLDVWVGFSSLFIFAAFFENVFVVADRSGRPATLQTDGIPNKKDVPEVVNSEKEKRKLIDIFSGRLRGKDSNVDALARMAFPSVFVLFNVIYIAYYLI